MRRVSIFLAAAALAGLLVVSAASAGAGGTARPFQATLTGVVTYVVPAACPGDPPDIANCGAFRSNTVATGEVSHLGRVEAHFSHLPYDFGNVQDGSMTLIAANGDELYGVYDFDLFSDSPILVTLTGGTGRFAEATGTISMTAGAIPQFKPPPCNSQTDFFGCLDAGVPWPWSGAATGAISY